MASSSGYWLVATSGQVYAFNAPAYGSTGPLNAPAVGIEATPSYGGYWVIALDGGVFTFGNAGFYGSNGGKQLNAQNVGMASTGDGNGYWLVGADGGIFTFGDAPYWGSLPGVGVKMDDVIGIIRFSNGYCIGEANGWIHCWDSQYQGTSAIVFQIASLNMLTDPATTIIPNSYDYYGLWLVDRTGQVWAWQADGTSGLSSTPNGPITGGSSWGGAAYNLSGADGGVFTFGLPYEGNASVSYELSPTAAEHYAQATLPQANWGTPGQWTNGLYPLWVGESGWQWNVCNGGGHYPTCNYTTLAYGIPQSLPGSKMCSSGPSCPWSTAWETNAWTQMLWGYWYIGETYNNPANAYATWLSRNPHWYAPTA